MQRWIVTGVLAALLVVAVLGTAAWAYKRNLPNPIWVPLGVNRSVSEERLEEIATDLKKKLSAAPVLAGVSKDVGLPQAWGMDSDSEAAAELGKRLFVRTGEMDTPSGRAPSLHIGVEGPRKDKDISAKIAMRLMKDVWPILGIKPPEERKQAGSGL